MIKTAIFSDALDTANDNPTAQYVRYLAESLAQQSISVTVIGHEPQATPLHFKTGHHLQVLYPFKKWNLFELALVFPLLMQLKPDVLHVFQPQKRHSLFSCYPLLFDILDITYRPAKILSVINHNWSPRTLEILSRNCDYATVQFPHLLNEWSPPHLHRRKKVQYVPMMSHGLSTDEKENTQKTQVEFSVSCSKNTKALFIPAHVSQLLSAQKTFTIIIEVLKKNQNTQVVFNGGWDGFSTRRRSLFWKSAHHAGVAGRIQFLERSSEYAALGSQRVFFWLSPINPIQLDIGYCLDWCFKTGSIPLVCPQNYSHPHPEIQSRWIPCQNKVEDVLKALELSSTKKDNRKAHLEVADPSQEWHRNALSDHPANVISRIYHEVLANKDLSKP